LKPNASFASSSAAVFTAMRLKSAVCCGVIPAGAGAAAATGAGFSASVFSSCPTRSFGARNSLSSSSFDWAKAAPG